MGGVAGHAPPQLHISQQEGLVESRPFEFHSARLADTAVSAVTASYKAGANSLEAAGSCELGYDAAVSLAKAGKGDSVLNVPAATAKKVEKCQLCLLLRHEQEPTERPFELGQYNVKGHLPTLVETGTGRPGSLGDQRIGGAHLRQHLKGARLNQQRS